MLLRRCPKASLCEIANEFGICATHLSATSFQSCVTAATLASLFARLYFLYVVFFIWSIGQTDSEPFTTCIKPRRFQALKGYPVKREITAWDCVGALRCINTIWHQIPQPHSFLYLLGIRVYICFSSYCIWADWDQRRCFYRRVRAQVQRRAASMAFVEEALSWEGGISAYWTRMHAWDSPQSNLLEKWLWCLFY